MKAYAYYNEFGEITSTITQQDDLPPATMAGRQCIEIPVGIAAERHWVSGGTLVAYSSTQLAAKSAQPDHPARWDPASGVWVDLRNLEDARADKNARINAARLKANQSTFTFAGHEIAVDPLSRSDIDGAHGAWLLTGGPPPGWPGGWKAVDNTIVPIPDMATWAAFYGTMVATGTANFNHAQLLKAQLAAATTIAEVESVPDW